MLPTILAACESSTSQTRPTTGSSANGPLVTTTRLPPVQNGTTESHKPFVFPGLLPYTLPLRSASSATNILPAVLQMLLQQIKNGEFVNFNQLLPSASLISTDEYAIKVNQDPSSP